MHPNESDLLDNRIYLEINGTLAKRIDFAWSVYSGGEQYIEEQKKRALQFLIYAFDISDTNDVNLQLIQLMAQRQRYQAINPEYIPGKSPARIPFDPRTDKMLKTDVHGVSRSDIQNRATADGEILDVHDGSKELDRKKNAIYLTAEERAQYRVHLSKGAFQQNGRNFDTSQMIAHEKVGFAAFTLNANGELSVFNHKLMSDRIAHSSMNAGFPVVTAGELKIENGVLKAITTHSGHYQPSMFNVHRLLEHLERNGIDISQVKVISGATTKQLDPECKAVKFTEDGRYLYETQAMNLYTGINKIFKENISSIDAAVKSYTDGGLLTRMYKLKDKVTGSQFTKERIALAMEFEVELNKFKESFTTNLSSRGLNLKIDELDKLITKYDQANKDLALHYDKSENDGRLAKKMNNYKEKLAELKDETSQQESTLSADMKKMW